MLSVSACGKTFGPASGQLKGSRSTHLRACLLLAALLCCAGAGRAQDQDEWPKPGLYPGGAYQLSNIETVNTSSGALMLNIPLAALPAGRGGSPGFQLFLHYDSKWLKAEVEEVVVPNRPDIIQRERWLKRMGVGTSWLNTGAWRYGLTYDMQTEALDPKCDQPGGRDIYKLRVTFPDGGVHEFRPAGFDNNSDSGFYPVRSNGGRPCGLGNVTGPLSYYSIDGSYVRLVFANDGTGGWGIYFPGGGRVEGGAGPQRTYDRNGNLTREVAATTLPNGHEAYKATDHLGRSITIERDAGAPGGERHYVYTAGFANAEELRWTVAWTTTNVNRQYSSLYGCDHGTTQELRNGLKVVDRITLPQQAGGLSFSFTYNGKSTPLAPPPDPVPSLGFGELNSVTLPSGAKAYYHYAWDLDVIESAEFPCWRDVLDDSPVRKELVYRPEYDLSSPVSNEPCDPQAETCVTETWHYGGDHVSGFITGPDGRFTFDYLYDKKIAHPFSGLSYKTRRPDSSVVERDWQLNTPSGARPANPYVRTEYISIPDAAGNLVKTAANAYAYDKNGNVTQVREYDWVDYGAVHDSGGNPTWALPGALLRQTNTEYYNPTPDASDSAYTPNSYHVATWLYLWRLPKSSEVSAGGAPLARTEFVYDDTFAKGNVTGRRSWDSTRGGLLAPATGTGGRLDATNSVSSSNEYDSYGNLTLTTDANGNQTKLTYGAVGNFDHLYPTTVEAAFGTAVKRTSASEYDFYTGAVVRATDVENDVSTATEYDALGRPTKVIAAEGKPEETQAVTVYSESDRRVVVRSDLNTAGDGKLVSIRHYDQLGRVRLNRSLEVASAQGEADESAGIKVQMRYKFAGTNSYRLVSNPYRAARATDAGGEETMGWALSTADQGGRVVRVETFRGAGLPAPFAAGSANINSTGAVVTAYDANTVTVTDQAGRQRRSVSDALGRLARLDEPDKDSGALDAGGSPVQPTVYGYDALGNLTLVRQGGDLQSGVYTGGQTRGFAYNSLSRLTSAANPEACQPQQGLCVPVPTTYDYDPAGNLVRKTDPRGVTAHYVYDALSRVTRRWYNGSGSLTATTHNSPALPAGVGLSDEVRYFYDSQALPAGAPASFDRGYATGRLVAITYGGGSSGTYLAYDAAGRAVLSVQQTGGVNYQVGPVTYNLAGAVTSQRYPSGHAVSYNYDAAGRLGDRATAGGTLPAFSGNLGDGVQRTYASEVLYHATGAMGQERFGTDTPLYNKHLYNSRGQLAEIRVGLHPLTDPDPQRATGWQRGAIINDYSDTGGGVTGGGADNNGNLKRQEVYIPNVEGAGYDQNWSLHTQVFTYDWLNRLSSAAESGAGGWSQQYGYDGYGNRTVTAAGSSNAPAPQFTVDAATNRLGVPAGQAGTMSYDAAGNIVYDDYTGKGARAYDTENRMTSAADQSGGTAAYVYDGDGRRVKRMVGGAGEVWQVYGLGGELLAEYAKDASPNQPRKEYGYRGGELLVTAEANAGGWGPVPAFTDESLAGKVVQSLYVTELREAVDSLRAHKGMAAYQWRAVAAPRAPITAESFLELRRALDEALGAPAAAYTAALEPRQPIRAVFIEELRKRVLDAWQGGSAGADIRWLVADQLGTPRMVVDRTGSLAGVTRHDYLPFGEELFAGTGGRMATQGYRASDSVRQKFTGSERDSETGLDYMRARYFSSTQGRFAGADPLLASGRTGNPQSWNRFTYVLNNPLRLTDPSGMQDQDKTRRNAQITLNPPPIEFGSTVRVVEQGDVDTSEAWSAAIGFTVAVPTLTQMGSAATAGTATAGALACWPLAVGGAVFYVGETYGTGFGQRTQPLWPGATSCVSSGSQNRPTPFPLPLPMPLTDNPPDNRGGTVTYYHYTDKPLRMPENGLWVGSAATTIPNLHSMQASQGLGIRPPTLVYPVTIDPRVTEVTPVSPTPNSNRYAGGLPEVFFPQGTPPGSVGLPRQVPP